MNWPDLPHLTEQVRRLHCKGAAYRYLFGEDKRKDRLTVSDRAKIILKLIRSEPWEWGEIAWKLKLSKGDMGKVMMFLNHNNYVDSQWVHEQGKNGRPRKSYMANDKGRRWIENN